MNFKKKILLLFLYSIVSISCERDDICTPDTPTTPRLIIDFLSISDLASPKNVPLFAAKGVGNLALLENYEAITSSQVILPLKTDENSTQYSLYQNAEINENGDIISGNEDIITITYTTEVVYVSRACGYKTIFSGVAIEFENDSDNWIQIIQPLNDNQSVENETTIHFNLFH